MNRSADSTRNAAITASVRIATMDCAAEESEIRRTLEPVSGILTLSFQLGARMLTITAPQPAVDAALAAIRRAGFDPQPLAPPTPGTAPAGHAHEMQDMTGGLARLERALLLAIAAEGIAWRGRPRSLSARSTNS